MAPPFSYRIRFLVITFRSTRFMTSALNIERLKPINLYDLALKSSTQDL